METEDTPKIVVSDEDAKKFERLMCDAHSEFPPSKLEQYSKCPFSWQYRNVPQETSEAAEEGTLLHAGIADMIAGCAEASCFSDFNDEQMEMINYCYNAFVEAKSTFIDPEIGVEEELDLFDNGKVITWGTADCFGVRGDQGFLIDFKFGRIEVPAPEDNLQICTYATALAQRFNLKVVECWIVQPRLHKKLHFTFDVENMAPMTLVYVKHVIKKCKEDEPKAKPGIEQCRYCAGKQQCPKVREKFESLQKANMSANELKTLDIHVLSKLYEAGQIVSQFIDMVGDEFKHRLEEGGDFEGYTLKRTSGGYKCPSPAVVYERVQDVLTPAQMIGACSCSLPKLKAAYAESAVALGIHETKKDAIDFLMDDLKEYLIPNAERVSITRSKFFKEDK